MRSVTIIAGETSYVNDRAVSLQQSGHDVTIFRAQPAGVSIEAQIGYYESMRTSARDADEIHTDIPRIAEDFSAPSARVGAKYVVEMFVASDMKQEHGV